MILVQSYVNLGMNLGLMPVTGIPLPFVSSGGSSLISLLAAEGVVQSILMHHRSLELAGSGKKYT
jgi:cell division protein FtsW (lipid II flippase)